MLSIDSSHFSTSSTSSTAPLHLSSVTIYPHSPEKAVLSGTTQPDSADEEMVFALDGLVEIPLNGKKITTPVSGTITGAFCDDDTFQVSFTDATGEIDTLEITHELHMEHVTVALSSCRYRADVRISAKVIYHDQKCGLSAEGDLNDIINYSEADNGQSMCISTLLQDASLHIASGDSLSDGTLRFFLWSHPHVLGMENYQIDEDNEMLYQSDSASALFPLPLKSIPDKPVTFGARLCPQDDDRIYLAFEIFPAQLALQFLSSDTEFFIHGESYDAPFILKTRDTWCAGISNNVHLGITAQGSGNLIVKSSLLIKGSVKGTGNNFPECTISSPNTFSGILFPDSPLAQELPDQELHLFCNSPEDFRLSLTLQSPLHLKENTILETQDGSPKFAAIISADSINITTPLYRIIHQKKTALRQCRVDSSGRCFPELQS